MLSLLHSRLLFLAAAAGGSVLVAACAADSAPSSPAPLPPPPSSPSADAGTDGDGAPEGGDGSSVTGSVPCWPGNTAAGYDTACRPLDQMCVHDYAGVSQYPRPNSCQPLVPECLEDRTCDCVKKHFRCGVVTSCSLTPGGLVRVVCQPD